MKNQIVLAAIALLFFANTASAQPKSEYRIANRFHVDGDGGWDYLTKEEGTDRLFISHGTMVQVLDVKAGKVIGTIPDTKGVHGIALAPDLNRGFISNGRDTSVTVFNLNTLATITKVKVTGINPDAILYEAYTHRVFAFNGKTNNVTVLDGKNNAVILTIPLAGKPEFAVTNGKGEVYVNIEDKSLLCTINTSTLKVVNSWSLSPGEEPSGLAIDVATQRLFSVCANKTMVISDAFKGEVITTLPIGEGADGAAFDPATKRAYSSNGDTTMTVVQETADGKFQVVETVRTQKGARTIAVDAHTHHLYLPAAEFGEKPAPTAENPKPRAKIKEGTFVILDIVREIP